MNGILKTELISSYYETTEQAALQIGRCIIIYNHRRWQSSLNWQIPADVPNQKEPQIKLWENYYWTPKNKEVIIQEP